MSRGKFNKSCCRVALPLAREIIFLRKNGELLLTFRGLAEVRDEEALQCPPMTNVLKKRNTLHKRLHPAFRQPAVVRLPYRCPHEGFIK